jgi:hypothetical protein
MKLKHPWITRLIGRTAARAAQATLATMDIQAVYADPTADPLHPQCQARYLYLTWHECIVFGLALRAHANMIGIASEHRDGELLNQGATALGWKMVRGSTTRGSVAALKRLLRLPGGHLNIAPDGPQGPRRRLAPGAIYLAAKTGLPLVCCAYGFHRPKRLNSWDRLVIPRPFSRARAVYGPPLHLPRALDRTALEHCRRTIEDLMNQLTAEAEQWAFTGESKPDQVRLHLRKMPRDVARAPDRFRTPLSREAAAIASRLQACERFVSPNIAPTRAA